MWHKNLDQNSCITVCRKLYNISTFKTDIKKKKRKRRKEAQLKANWCLHRPSHLQDHSGTITAVLHVWRLCGTTGLSLGLWCCLLLTDGGGAGPFGFIHHLDGVSRWNRGCFHVPILDREGALHSVIQELVLFLLDTHTQVQNGTIIHTFYFFYNTLCFELKNS